MCLLDPAPQYRPQPREVRENLLLELVVEDGFDRAVGQRADLDGASGGGIQPCRTDRAFQLQDAKAGPEPLLGMRPALQDQRAQGADGRPNCGCVAGDSLDGPARMAAMARRHVVGRGRMLAVAAATPMRGNALAAQKHLDRTGGQPDIDLGPGKR